MSKLKENGKKKYLNLSIAEIMLIFKTKAYLFASIIIIMTCCIYIGGVKFVGISFDYDIVIALIILLFLTIAAKKLLKFRIQKGYYGKNEYEIRELISFIIEKSKYIDFTENRKSKRIFP